MNVSCPFCGSALTLNRNVQRALELSACEQCLNPLLLQAGTAPAIAIKGAQDTRGLLDENSIAGRLLKSVRGRMDDLPILPEMSSRILQLCGDPNSSIQDLAGLIAEDAVVASRVIQVANSAYYRGLSEITDITTACARLGMRTVANTAQSVALKHVFRGSEARFTETMQTLWRHSIAVAHLSSEIAILLSIPHSEMVYLMGLMHDIGKIAITQAVSDAVDASTQAVRENEELFFELLGRFHTLVGLHIGLRWNLPADFLVGIYYHHNPEAAPSDTWRRTAHVVALADAIAHVTNCPSERQSDISLITSPSTAFFSLSDVKLAALRVDLEDRMDHFLGAIAH